MRVRRPLRAAAPPAAGDLTGRWPGARTLSRHECTLSQVGDTVAGPGLHLFSWQFGDLVRVDTFRLAVMGGLHGTACSCATGPKSCLRGPTCSFVRQRSR